MNIRAVPEEQAVFLGKHGGGLTVLHGFEAEAEPGRAPRPRLRPQPHDVVTVGRQRGQVTAGQPQRAPQALIGVPTHVRAAGDTNSAGTSHYPGLCQRTVFVHAGDSMSEVVFCVISSYLYFSECYSTSS